MNAKKIEKKLTLNKETIAALSVNQLQSVLGGAAGTRTCPVQECPPSYGMEC